jgi:hypothetical protein
VGLKIKTKEPGKMAEIPVLLVSRAGGLLKMQTFYASMYGVLIFFAALIPPLILIIDKAGF